MNNYSAIIFPAVLLRRLFRLGYTLLILPAKTFLLSKFWRMKCGKKVTFVGKTIVRAYERNAITIGDNVQFVSSADKNLVGLVNPTIICAIKGGHISIGDFTGLSSPVIHARKSIQIGRYVNVGGNVRIFDHDFHPLEWKDRRPPQKGEKTRVRPVVIEDDCFIGANAIILKGTHLGARSIVAAGSVVFGLDVPPDSMVKGNPASVVKRKQVLG